MSNMVILKVPALMSFDQMPEVMQYAFMKAGIEVSGSFMPNTAEVDGYKLVLAIVKIDEAELLEWVTNEIPTGEFDDDGKPIKQKSGYDVEIMAFTGRKVVQKYMLPFFKAYDSEITSLRNLLPVFSGKKWIY